MIRESVQDLAQGLGFPARQWSDGEQGLHARYDHRDRLTEMHWLVDGVPGRRRLRLLPDQKTGELVVRLDAEREDREVYAEGRVEAFDAWSDNQRPRSMGWGAWTRRCVASLLGQHRCLLCGEGINQCPAAAHTPDDLSHLCRPCWKSLEAQAPHARAWPLGERVCRVCRESFGDDALMHERRSGKLCLPCAQALRPVV